jgi:glycosyltransferase involved in cell wall biosynthesis
MAATWLRGAAETDVTAVARGFMQVCNVCLTHDPAFGGLYRSVQDFSRALAAPIVSFDNGPFKHGEGERLNVEEGVPVRRLCCGTGWLARDCHVMSSATARRADAAVADADLLVVHSLFRGHATWAQAWAKQHGRRYWAVPHGCLDPWGLSHRGMLKRLWLEARGRSFLAHADRIVVSSRRSLDKSLAWIPDGRPADRTVVVHWPVDLPRLDERATARAAFRQQHGIPESARLLLSVGRLHVVKRPVETVRAFCEATAAASLQHCHLAIVGMDGDLTQADIHAAIPPACRGRVHVIGPLAGADLAAAQLAGDGFISLSFQENFGYAAAEAMAYGLPVILSPGHDLAHEMPALAGRFACGWLLGDDADATAVAAIREFATASDGQLAAAGGIGRTWVAETLAFERFRDRLTAMV